MRTYCTYRYALLCTVHTYSTFAKKSIHTYIHTVHTIMVEETYRKVRHPSIRSYSYIHFKVMRTSRHVMMMLADCNTYIRCLIQFTAVAAQRPHTYIHTYTYMQ